MLQRRSEATDGVRDGLGSLRLGRLHSSLSVPLPVTRVAGQHGFRGGTDASDPPWPTCLPLGLSSAGQRRYRFNLAGPAWSRPVGRGLASTPCNGTTSCDPLGATRLGLACPEVVAFPRASSVAVAAPTGKCSCSHPDRSPM